MQLRSRSSTKTVPPSVLSASTYESAFARSIAPDAHAFSFWKGRIALFAILKALGIRQGDEVILPGYTCIVVANAIRFTGAQPVYADIASDGFNIDPQRVSELVSPSTKAILVQHTYGISGPVYDILELAQRRNIAVIEDCAHALGSQLDGKPLGSFGDAAFFSSQWSKPYTTGLGGMAVTRDEELAERLGWVHQKFVQPSAAAQLQLRLQLGIYENYYSPRIYWHAQSILQNFGRLGLFVASSSDSELAGDMPVDFTWQMSSTQQEAGVKKLADFAKTVEHRQQITSFYDKALLDAGWSIPKRTEGTVILRYPVCVANKEALLLKARQDRVELGSWFETPLHPTPLAQHPQFGFQLGCYPNAERMAAQVVNLPMHEWITEKEAERMVNFFITNALPVGKRILPSALPVHAS